VRLTSLFVLVCGVALAGCGDDPTEPAEGSCFNTTTGAESALSVTNSTFNVGVPSQLLL
jgi:hypothetical protein